MVHRTQLPSGSGPRSVTIISKDLEAFSARLMNRETVTKREILKTIVANSEPPGFVDALIMRAKSLFREVFGLSVEWDEELNEDIQSRWRQWTAELNKVKAVRIPRLHCLKTIQVLALQLHLTGELYQHSRVHPHLFLRTQIHELLLGNTEPSNSLITPLHVSPLQLQGALQGSFLSHTLPLDYYYFTPDLVQIHLALEISKIVGCTQPKTGEKDKFNPKLWWKGGAFLQRKSSLADLASKKFSLSRSKSLEEAPTASRRPSLLIRLVRSTPLVLRFLRRIKPSTDPRDIKLKELEVAEKQWWRRAQLELALSVVTHGKPFRPASIPVLSENMIPTGCLSTQLNLIGPKKPFRWNWTHHYHVLGMSNKEFIVNEFIQKYWDIDMRVFQSNSTTCQWCLKRKWPHRDPGTSLQPLKHVDYSEPLYVLINHPGGSKSLICATPSRSLNHLSLDVLLIDMTAHASNQNSIPTFNFDKFSVPFSYGAVPLS